MWNYQPPYLYSSTWTLHVLNRILTRKGQSWHARLFAICALGALSARLGWCGPSGLRCRLIWLCSRTGLVWQNPMVYHGLYMGYIWVMVFSEFPSRPKSLDPPCRQVFSCDAGSADPLFEDSQSSSLGGKNVENHKTQQFWFSERWQRNMRIDD